jgi:hypothetical protein
MSSTKEAIATLLSQLPDDCTLEDIQYHLYVLTKVQQGIESAKQDTIPQPIAEQQLSKWLTP